MPGRPWIVAGAVRDESLPVDRLVDGEHRELQAILAAHGAVREQLAAIEHRLSLFVVTARDRRGLAGRVQVDPETGAIQAGGQDGRD